MQSLWYYGIICSQFACACSVVALMTSWKCARNICLCCRGIWNALLISINCCSRSITVPFVSILILIQVIGLRQFLLPFFIHSDQPKSISPNLSDVNNAEVLVFVCSRTMTWTKQRRTKLRAATSQNAKTEKKNGKCETKIDFYEIMICHAMRWLLTIATAARPRSVVNWCENLLFSRWGWTPNFSAIKSKNENRAMIKKTTAFLSLSEPWNDENATQKRTQPKILPLLNDRQRWKFFHIFFSSFHSNCRQRWLWWTRQHIN